MKEKLQFYGASVIFLASSAVIFFTKSTNEGVWALAVLFMMFSFLYLQRHFGHGFSFLLWYWIIFFTYKILSNSYYLEDQWMSQFYLEIGTAIITVVIVDMLLLSRKGEEKAQMDRIEKKLDELLERKKD